MLETFGYELVIGELKGPARAQTLTLYIDKPGGVDGDECAEMVKKVAVVLETLDAQRHNYNIIVSLLIRPPYGYCMVRSLILAARAFIFSML